VFLGESWEINFYMGVWIVEIECVDASPIKHDKFIYDLKHLKKKSNEIHRMSQGNRKFPWPDVQQSYTAVIVYS
jgi:hypothetical protein